MLNVEAAEIPDIKIITVRKIEDRRGFLSEVYARRAFADSGLDFDFVQDNHSSSAKPGTLRGLHFQIPPFAQVKLVRVIRGRVLDVAVDLRRTSPTFGRHCAIGLSADNWKQVLVPVGFAHGYLTLEPDTEVIYKVTNYHAPAHERGLAWNDPALAIDWRIDADRVILSDRDRKHPRLAALPGYFD
ncbi:MAG: dTDP-4-dehydrorhamnose 3,5-epimerase [Methylovirgula sp.]